MRTILALALATASLALAPRASAQAPEIEVKEVAETGSMPKGAVLSPDGKRFYVTNFGMANGHNITVYDATTLALVDTIYLPGITVECLLSHDGATIYASNFARDSVQVVDVRTHHVKREIDVGMHPKILALGADEKTLFAANWNGNSVTQIDLPSGRVVTTLDAGSHPRGMALTRAGQLYVANFDGASIDVFDPPPEGQKRYHWATRLAICPIPRHLALSPDDRTLYVSCYHDSALAALDLATWKVVHTVPIGKNPKAIAVSGDGRYVYSADYGEESHSVSVVDTTDWRARVFVVPGMDRGSGIAVEPDGTRALVTGWFDNHVYLVGFTGPGGHPREALDKIETWVHHRHWHKVEAKSGGS